MPLAPPSLVDTRTMFRPVSASLVALLGVQAAQLVLDIHSPLAAHVEQILAVDVQLARQRVNTDLFFQQAALLRGRTGTAGRPVAKIP